MMIADINPPKIRVLILEFVIEHDIVTRVKSNIINNKHILLT